MIVFGAIHDLSEAKVQLVNLIYADKLQRGENDAHSTENVWHGRDQIKDEVGREVLHKDIVIVAGHASWLLRETFNDYIQKEEKLVEPEWDAGRGEQLRPEQQKRRGNQVEPVVPSHEALPHQDEVLPQDAETKVWLLFGLIILHHHLYVQSIIALCLDICQVFFQNGHESNHVINASDPEPKILQTILLLFVCHVSKGNIGPVIALTQLILNIIWTLVWISYKDFWK